MQIGNLRHRITFQEEAKEPDGYKGFTVTWKDVVTVWASIIPLSGREYFHAHQITSEVTHRIRTRYRTDIDTSMKIKLGERIFSIESIIDLEERHVYLELYCKE